MKVIIFDASTLISFAMNGLFNELRELKRVFKGKFIVTEQVKREIIDRPINIKRFELEALKLQQLLIDKVLELPSALKIDNQIIASKTDEFLRIANNLFVGRGKEIKLISLGETSCLALSRILDQKKIQNVIAIDERTTRMLVEKPENLKKLLQKKIHSKVELKKADFKSFKGFRFIRSTELIYVAYKKGLIKLKHKKILDALLWALKFKGCSINGKEINEIKNIG